MGPVGTSVGRYRGILRALAALHALLFLAAAAFAQEDGSYAPRSGWSTEGGCAARTSASGERPLRGPVEAAWTAQGLPGIPVGEPLCSGPFALVECTGSQGLSWIAILRLADGAVVAKRSFKTDLTLTPTFEGGLITVRSGARRVSTLRFRAGALTDVWSVEAPDRVLGVIAFGREVYVTSPTGLHRYDIGSPKPVWSHATPACGRPALRGPHVYAVFPESRASELAALRRSDGRASARIRIHEVAEDDRPRISVLQGTVVVQHGDEFPRDKTIAGNTTKVRRKIARDSTDVALMEPVTSHVLGRPIVMGNRWAAVMRWLDATQFVISHEDGNESDFLADASTHPEWIQPLDGASQARGVLYANGRALDMWSQRILWTVPGAAAGGSWTPAGRLLLQRTADGRIVAWRDRNASGAPSVDVAGGIPGSAAPGAVALYDGSVLLGSIRAEGGDVVVATAPAAAAKGAPAAAAEVRVPRASVCYAEDDTLRILLAPDRAELVESISAIARARAASAWGALLRDGMASRDPELLARIHGNALSAGAPDADLTQIDSRIRMLRRENRGGTDDAKVAARLQQSFDAIEASLRRPIFERLARLPGDVPAAVECDMLISFFASGDDDEDARRRVLALLPAEYRPTGPFDPLDWLQLAETLRTMPVKIVLPPKKDGPDVTPAMRQVGIAQHRWRKDVVGVETPYMVIVAPVGAPAGMARCVAVGEIVAKNLEEMFALGSRARVKGPLVTLLFDEYEDYAKHSKFRGYEPVEEGDVVSEYMSREEELFVHFPDDRPLHQYLSSYASSVAQQWLAERCPSIGKGAIWNTPSFEGQWASDGLYWAVWQMQFDLGARDWSQDPEAFALDMVTSLPPGQLFPWAKLVDMRSSDYVRLDRKSGVRIVSRSRLEMPPALAPRYVAAYQCSAMVMYLLDAEDGVHRRRFADYLVACYEGRAPEFAAHFGFTPSQLGERVVAWARRSLNLDAPK